jgi:hypothetical protein
MHLTYHQMLLWPNCVLHQRKSLQCH